MYYAPNTDDVCSLYFDVSQSAVLVSEGLSTCISLMFVPGVSTFVFDVWYRIIVDYQQVYLIPFQLWKSKTKIDFRADPIAEI